MKKIFLYGVGVGVLLASINFVFMGFPGLIFQHLYPFFGFLFRNCSGDECWGFMIILGSVLFLVTATAIGAFIGYAVDKKNYPYNLKKLLIMFFIILIIALINVVGFIDSKSGLFNISKSREDAKIKNWENFQKDLSTKKYYNTTGDYAYAKTIIEGEIGSKCGYSREMTGEEYSCISEQKINSLSIELYIDNGEHRPRTKIIEYNDLTMFSQEPIKDETSKIKINYNPNDYLSEEYYEDYICIQYIGNKILTSPNPKYDDNYYLPIFLFDDQGSELKKISNDGELRLEYIALSPDYSKIAFTKKQKDERLKIGILDINTNEIKYTENAFGTGGYSHIKDIYWNKNNKIVIVSGFPTDKKLGAKSRYDYTYNLYFIDIDTENVIKKDFESDMKYKDPQKNRVLGPIPGKDMIDKTFFINDISKNTYIPNYLSTKELERGGYMRMIFE